MHLRIYYLYIDSSLRRRRTVHYKGWLGMPQAPVRNKMQRMFDMTALSSMYLRGVRQVDMA